MIKARMKMARLKWALPALFTLVAGCAESDPYRRAGMWHPSGANAANIAAMASRPADLVRGRDTAHANGQEAVSAVQRMRDADLTVGASPTGAPNTSVSTTRSLR